jgi:uncharacterized YigZ family protein
MATLYCGLCFFCLISGHPSAAKAFLVFLSHVIILSLPFHFAIKHQYHMTTSYSIPSASHQYEFEIKRSKFICYVGWANGRAAAEAFIQSVRAEHPQARHVCWAYIAGAPNTTVMSMSDDGEPSGTAGRPMLKVLQYSGLGEIVVAVVRYFGGIKLGTGGLQRAYSDAVAGALEHLPLTLQVARTTVELVYDYALESQIRHILSKYDAANEQVTYTEQVNMLVDVADADLPAFQMDVVNQTSNAARLTIQS